MIELLACNCKSCISWEVVRLEDGSIHLHCKTCDRRDELDAFTIHEQPGNQVKWIQVERE